MVSRNGATNSTLEVSGAKGRSDLESIQIPTHFDTINGSIISAKFESMDWIAILPLVSNSISSTVGCESDRMISRPSALRASCVITPSSARVPTFLVKNNTASQVAGTPLPPPLANVVGVSIVRSRNGAPSRKGCVVNGQITKASNQ